MKKLLLIQSFFLIYQLHGFDLRPVPWITEEAISFLESFLSKNPEARVLEFGMGASTVWIAKRTPHLVSVEHSDKWYDFIINELTINTECYSVEAYLRNRPYSNICTLFSDNYFDLVLVDGRNRKACMRDAVRVLKPGGVMMLDNAERKWYQSAIQKLFKGWQFHRTIQNKPDSCDFFYKNWQTNWWIKPLS